MKDKKEIIRKSLGESGLYTKEEIEYAIDLLKKSGLMPGKVAILTIVAESSIHRRRRMLAGEE